METYSDHSAILDYLAQVEQEEQLRESLKSKSGIAALRVEKGDAPGSLSRIYRDCSQHDLLRFPCHRRWEVCSLSSLLDLWRSACMRTNDVLTEAEWE